MIYPYVAGMLTMFSLLIFKEFISSPKYPESLYIHDQEFIFISEDLDFPYGTTYLRATFNKYKEYELVVNEIIKDRLNPICTDKDYQVFLNQSMKMCYE